MSDDLIKREDAIKAIHNYWKKRLDTLPTKESEYGEVYADIQQMDKILEHNKILCNFIESIPSADIDLSEYSDKLWKSAYERGKADRPQGEWKPKNHHTDYCSNCGFEETQWRTVDYNFCPSCGARMKGVDDEHTI